ncbi:MAG: tRNA pseudouridine(54/55) synthase Pus10, partial [Candidatus Aenigmatarchaeota archaeon]
MGFEKHIDKRILKIAKDIVEKWNVCDNCLGRQFAQIGRGFTNQERGRVIRKVLLSKKQAKPFDPKKGCEVCLGFFQNIDKWVEKALKALRGLEFQSFLVGTLMSDEFAKREESLWEDVGIEYCESIKAEINREVGKLIEKKTGKKVDKENPDVVITLDLQNQKIDIRITSVYFYGEYKKLIRGIPQTKWDKYPLTIEDIIAKPFMEALKGKAHAMHAAGREDIDARCLDWRPFVLEIIEPKKRDTDLSKIQKIINETGMIEVRNLRKTDRHDVVRVKSMSPDKTYRILVEFEKPLKDLERLKSLIG